MKTFVQACVENPEVEIDIDEWIADWHEGRAGSGLPLHEFLGMSWKEYARWVRDPEALPDILDAARTRA